MFSDAPTSSLWVGNIKAGLQQKDIASVFSSFGAIRRIKLGAAPPSTSATGLSAEVQFASVAQAAAALTALNAIVVPRLSGHHPLAIQCWQPSGSGPSHSAPPASAPASHARPATTPLVVPRPLAAAAKAGPAAPAVPAAPAAAPGPLGPQQDVRPFNRAEAAAAVELPGAEDLQAAAAFFEGCSFLAVPEEERGSAVKWAVLQALLSRGLRHVGGCTFRQLPVLLTQLGDELLKHRGSNPAVEAEYQSYPAAGRLTSLLRDIRFPGLVRVHKDGSNTNVVQLHLGQLALAGGAPGGTPGGSAAAGSGGSGSATPPPKQRPSKAAGAGPSPKSKPPPPPQNQYETSSTPSRHLVLLGVAQRADVEVLTDIARQHGVVQKFLLNPRKASLTLHFSGTEGALSMAREVEGQVLPGMSGSSPLQVAYKHPVPAGTAVAAGTSGAAGTAGAAGQPSALPAKQAAAAQPAAAKAGKAKSAPQVTWQYSATTPSCVVRVKKLDSSSATRQGLAQVGQSAGGPEFVDCTYFPSSGIGYLFFQTEAAASAAAAALRGPDLPWSQGEELVVEFRLPLEARPDGTPSTAAAGGGKGAAAAAAAGAAAAEEGPPCCACCGASGEGVALSRCSGCRVVHYCGRDCQLKDWAPRHATECAQLQQLAAALQAAQPTAAGAQAQLLVAALRSPGGREAAMLRSLLGADAVPAVPAAPGNSEQDGGGPSSGSAANGDGGSVAGEAAAAADEEQPASDGGVAAAEGAVGEAASDDGQAAEAAAAAEEPAAAAAAEGTLAVDQPSLAADGGSAAHEGQQQQAAVEQAAPGSEAALAAKEPPAAEATASPAGAEEQPAAEGHGDAEQQADAEQHAHAAQQQQAEAGADEQASAAAAAAAGQSSTEAAAAAQAADVPATNVDAAAEAGQAGDAAAAAAAAEQAAAEQAEQAAVAAAGEAASDEQAAA